MFDVPKQTAKRKSSANRLTPGKRRKVEDEPMTEPHLYKFQYDSTEALNDARARTATSFRPLALEQQVSSTIAHSDNQGKEAQCALECAQQARANRFLATPPVLRGAWDFGFHIRGLSVAHFQRVTRKTLLDRTKSTVNMTDFSWKNTLPAADPIRSYTDLVDALYNLRYFYNELTVQVLDAADAFIDKFGEGSELDLETTRI
ncbi:hypothetical protein PI126_g14314 [Phytophthora idaei]|nr:hypothetical protein PI126_g14314 [Phytophthora idaei]